MAFIDEHILSSTQFYQSNARFESSSHFTHMNNSFNQIGLTITSKSLSKLQKYSVETDLNNSFPRILDKQQQQENRDRKCSNLVSRDLALPFLNDSFVSGVTSARLNQTNYYFQSPIITPRILKRDKIIKSSSKNATDFQDLFIENCLINNNNSNDNVNKLIYPITPSDALTFYGDKLTQFEKSEIFSYEKIYFLGLEATKISGFNSKDFDDQNGFYKKMLKDQICYRFEICETLGKGSFGIVIRCYDHQYKQFVALKIIRNKKRFQQQGLVEINILTHLKALDQQNNFNIVHIKEYFYFRSHLCITFELLGINLYELIKKNHYQGFSIHLVKRFAKSLLQSLKIMCEQNVIHCDLKPENILLKEKGSSSIKLIDFGSSCFQSQRIYTYIQSRFYRAPEIILGIPYTSAIDMWSFACIIVELFTGYPLFPGENEEEQLSMIIEVVDLPPLHLLQQGTRNKLFFDSKGIPKNISTKPSKKRFPASRSIGEILRTNDNNFIDFIRRCLRWDPNQRLTAEEGLTHPWIIENKIKPKPICKLTKEDNFNEHSSNFNLNEKEEIRNLCQ